MANEVFTLTGYPQGPYTLWIEGAGRERRVLAHWEKEDTEGVLDDGLEGPALVMLTFVTNDAWVAFAYAPLLAERMLRWWRPGDAPITAADLVRFIIGAVADELRVRHPGAQIPRPDDLKPE